MDRLWAPWRSAYITSKKEKGCIFCTKCRLKDDKKNYIISRGEFVFSMLNIYPYNNGHVMVAPYRHVKDLDKLNIDEMTELMEHSRKIIKMLKKVLKPDAFNIGINMGRIAGAGFAEHLHIHIVPRWRGDTNFMPIIGKAKIISQSLDELYKRLKKVE